MAEGDFSVYATIKANTDNFQKGMKEAQSSLNSVSKSIEGVQKLLKSAFTVSGATLAIGTLTKALKSISAEAVNSSKQLKLLSNTVKITGASSWTTAKEMDNLANSISKSTNYSVDSIREMQTVLLGFKNITGDTFKDASEAITDMATVMGMDLKSATQTIGKALDDPIKGLDSLRRQGFAFTEEQKKELEQLVKNGEQMKAQKIILDELATTYGGAAKQAADSGTQLANNIKNLKGELGKGWNDSIESIKKVANVLVEKWTEAIRKINEAREAQKNLKEVLESGGAKGEVSEAKNLQAERMSALQAEFNDLSRLAELRSMKNREMTKDQKKTMFELTSIHEDYIMAFREDGVLEVEAVKKAREEKKKEWQQSIIDYQMLVEKEAELDKARKEQQAQTETEEENKKRQALLDAYDETIAKAKEEIEIRKSMGEKITEEAEKTKLLETMKSAYFKMLEDSNGEMKVEATRLREIAKLQEELYNLSESSKELDEEIFKARGEGLNKNTKEYHEYVLKTIEMNRQKALDEAKTLDEESKINQLYNLKRIEETKRWLELEEAAMKRIAEWGRKSRDLGLQGLTEWSLKRHSINKERIDEEEKTAKEEAMKMGASQKEIAAIETYYHKQRIKENIRFFAAQIKRIKAYIQNVINTIKSVANGVGKLFDMFSKDFDSLIDNMLVAGDKVLTFFVETMPQLSTKLGQLVNGFFQIVNSITSYIANHADEIQQQIMDTVTTVIDAVVNFIQSGGMEKLVQAVVTLFVGIINAISENLDKIVNAILDSLPIILNGIVQLIKSIVENLDKIIPALVKLVVGLITTLADLLSNDEFIDTLIEGIMKVVEILPREIIKNLPKIITAIVKVIAKIIEKLPDIIFGLIEVVLELLTDVNFWKDFAVDLIKALVTSLGYAVAGQAKMIAKIFKRLFYDIPKIMYDIGIDSMKGLINGMKDLPGKLTIFFSNIINWFTTLPKKITNVFVNLPKDMYNIGKNILLGLINGMKSFFTKVIDAIKGFFNKIINAVKNLLGIHSPSTVFKEIGVNILEGLLEGMKSFIGNVINWIKDFIQKIINAFLGILSKIYDCGKGVIKNLWSGISDMFTWFFDKLKAFLNKLVNLVKDAVEKIKNLLQEVASAAANFGINLWEGVKDLGTAAYEGGKNVLQKGASAAANVGSKLYDAIPKPWTWATGVQSAPRGLALVGEQGPELVRFNGGEQVLNTANTQKALNSAAAGKNITNNITFNNLQDTTAFAMIQQLKQYNRQLAINGVF